MPKRERLSEKGRIKEEVSVGKSLAADRRVNSKTVAKPGYGDPGDQNSRSKRKAQAKKK